MPTLTTIKKQIAKQVLTAQLSNPRFITFTAEPIVSEAATSSLFSAPAPTAVLNVMLHATDLTVFARLQALNNPDFATFIADTLARYGAKSLLITDPQNVKALQEKGYEVSQPSDKVLIPYDRLKANLMDLPATKSIRADHFAALQKKLDSGEWEFVCGNGSTFMKRIDLDKLTDFYQKHCPFSSGGFKTEYATYGKEGMMARFCYPDNAVMSFAIQTSEGELIAANHLLFSGHNADAVAYCYDNVVHSDYRSKEEKDSQHTYQFFLSQIAKALAKEQSEPSQIVIILGAQGQAGNGQRLSQLLIGEAAASSNAPVLMFKGAAPGAMMIETIADEKAHARQHVEAYLNAQHALSSCSPL
jgi:hypothetical protein